MKIIRRAAPFLLFALTLAAVQFRGTEALALSNYFSSKGCTGCHGAPVVASCNGCHHHGPASLKGATNKASYAPGETVSVTITGGNKTGWFRAVLYNQSTVEVARSTGSASGMGGSATYPAVLTAPAPAAAGTYTWKVAWYGNKYDSAALGASWVPDANNPNHGEVRVSTNSFTVVAAAPSDKTAPVVSAFTLPATSVSAWIPISTLTATDDVKVTGYMITTSATAPTAGAAGWSATKPTGYKVTGLTVGTPTAKTLYAWAKDAAGNVSLSKNVKTTITLSSDVTKPVLSAFTLPATSVSAWIPISTLTATDAVKVTGYLLTTTATTPTPVAAGWTAAKPTGYKFTGLAVGVPTDKTLYAWARDAAGNVSLSKSATTTITLSSDVTKPVLSAFALPATSASATVSITTLTATDNIKVTGYLLTTSATTPTPVAAGWTTSKPGNYTFSGVTAGVSTAKALYAWARDAAGNVSLSKKATTTITVVAGVSAAKSAARAQTPIALSALADGSVTANPVLNIAGLANSDTKGITINNAVTPITEGAFSHAVALNNGPNTITITATDNSGTTTTATRSITLDGNAPAMTVITPADNSATSVGVITIKGSTDALNIVTSAINGSTMESAQRNVDGFEATHNLIKGLNTIQITVSDLDGNKATVKRTIMYEPNAPSIAIISPSADITSTTAIQIIKGIITDAITPVSATITINGVTTPLALGKDNSFTYQLNLGKTNGKTAIIVTATDQAGNRATVQRNIILKAAK